METDGLVADEIFSGAGRGIWFVVMRCKSVIARQAFCELRERLASVQTEACCLGVGEPCAPSEHLFGEVVSS